MNDMMSAFLGYNPDDVVKERVEQFTQVATEMASDFDANYPDLQGSTRVFVRTILLTNAMLSHQVAALTVRPSGDFMWPAVEIHNGITAAARAAIENLPTEATE